jgi:hypothetical protein
LSDLRHGSARARARRPWRLDCQRKAGSPPRPGEPFKLEFQPAGTRRLAEHFRVHPQTNELEGDHK